MTAPEAETTALPIANPRVTILDRGDALPSGSVDAIVLRFADARHREALAERVRVEDPLHRTRVATPYGVASFIGYERVWFDLSKIELEIDMFSIPKGDGTYASHTRTEVLAMEEEYLAALPYGH